MRIFVMFGTQDKRFDRLLNAILESKFVKENDVYVQLGYTKGTYQGINYQNCRFNYNSCWSWSNSCIIKTKKTDDRCT